MQTNGINLSYFNLRFVDKQNSYERSTTSDCKDIGGRKSEFVAKTQFLSLKETNPRFSTLPFKSYELKWKICIFSRKEIDKFYLGIYSLPHSKISESLSLQPDLKTLELWVLR